MSRQLDEAHEHLERLGVEDIEEYPEIVSGAADTDTREVYNHLLEDVEEGRFDLVVVHEISRLSRLGPTEIHEFIQHCLEHDTGVEALDVGLKIHVDDGELQQTIYSMVARLMGDLAQIEHQQNLQRIRSGVRAAQSAGKWTGRPPAGFVVEDGYLRVDPAEFLHTREALARVDRGESFATVADDTGIAESTLRSLHEDRRNLYLGGEAEDDRIDEALTDVRPLEEARTEGPDLGELCERVERLEEATDIDAH
ncbi:recombinase family protein [Halorubrum ezzemoulense]|uniref:recombinase family protein n=1 Tax=Halorubrum ezzemoulense TaxID=337243 RepID=UPI001FC935C1|nr:recombinase family protein [Halorubrum ezzemoulense]